ncbi:hypothetical protein ACEN9X_25980 [Mucilaginibacter sp. Mucisp86]|uniref:hypothetical protein n=1 Tax=Mucilaginibacter sp. Mucisp86 TaxID=3243060 RepID=UPI0039B4C138
MSDYKDDYPASRRDNIKEVRESNTTDSDNYANRTNPCLETKGPHKKHFRVLHEDGSLADLPDPNVEGAGVGDGTIGR